MLFSRGEASMPEFLLLILVCVALLGLRLFAGGLDRDRVKKYVESQGGTFIESNWTPFGRGWFGEHGDRIYTVRYVDRDGDEHEAHCKTSMWSGVYLSEDRIVRHAPRKPDRASTLEAENQRLRAELQRLKQGQD
jgi:hypothetical protein